MDYSDQLDANRKNWDERVKIHRTDTEYYNIEQFKQGGLSFKAAEHLDLGEVNGKSLLHLQCHFGLDTMSFSRLGASATGVDFSQEAIDLATSLATELDLSTRFICSDVYKLPTILDETFDIVFSSVGVITWLPDLDRWARVVATHLKEGGTFFLKDGHPIINTVELKDNRLLVDNPYYRQTPWQFDDGRTYAGDSDLTQHPTNFQWDHTLSDIFQSLIHAGLKITRFEEYPYTFYQRYPNMEQNDAGFWQLAEPLQDHLPLSYLLMATK